MDSERSLLDLKVLVTRPENQAVKLCGLIEQKAGQAVLFPVIKIEGQALTSKTIEAISQQDILIFISRNAAIFFAKQYTKNVSEQCILVAIGQGTAESMREMNLSVDVCARSASSEGLLSLPELDNIQNKNVMIVRGDAGRALLSTTLQARGANIDYADVYNRLLARPGLAACQQAMQVDCVVCTSVAGVTNLCLLLEENLTKLLTKPLIVVSERIKEFALSRGFQHVMVTDAVNDHAIVQQLIEMELENGK